MAEGLEEESKKSLQMEAELEKQLAEFDTEKHQIYICGREGRQLEVVTCSAIKLHWVIFYKL